MVKMARGSDFVGAAEKNARLACALFALMHAEDEATNWTLTNWTFNWTLTSASTRNATCSACKMRQLASLRLLAAEQQRVWAALPPLGFEADPAEIPTLIRGHVHNDSWARLLAAYEYLDGLHTAPCTPSTKIVFKRMPTYGVANDLNEVLRAFAYAMRMKAQLVLLPPRAGLRAKLQSLAGTIDIQRPWHWMPRELGPLRSLLHESACQRLLVRTMPGALDAYANATPTSQPNARALAKRHGLPSSEVSPLDADVWMKRTFRMPLTLQYVPPKQLALGVLWGFQAMGTYLVRVRGALAARLRQHPALASAPSDRSSPPQRSLCWQPPSRYDVGVHIRWGDACSEASRKLHPLRHCLASFAAAASQMRAHNVSRGRLFIASDAQHIIDEALPSSAFAVSSLQLSRSKYELAQNIEDVQPRTNATILEEALLEILSLSRATVIAGGMAGNMPRLALVLRVQPPGGSPYITLDRYPFCVQGSCKPNIYRPTWKVKAQMTQKS